MNYHFDVIKDKIKGRPDLKLYTGNVKTYSFDFDFDGHWNGLIKFATFNSSTNTYVIELSDNSIIVPHEILNHTGPCTFGIYGTNANDDIKRISTNIIEFEILKGAYSDGLTPSEPTPDLWESLFRNSIPVIKDNYWHIFDLKEKKYVNTNIMAVARIPENGVDYFTEEEKLELINQLSNKINMSDYASKTELSNKVDKENGLGLSQVREIHYDPNQISSDTKALYSSLDIISVADPDTPCKIDFYNRQQIDTLLSTNVATTISPTLEVNKIYSIESFDNLTLNLPTGDIGSFIQVDFVTNDNPPTLTITSISGISDYDLVPEANMIYSLYFDWGIINYDSTNATYTYGWRFSYAEYTKTEV